MELIDICYPNSTANNLRFEFENALTKRDFKSDKWFIFTNEEHNMLILLTKISNNTDMVILKNEINKLKEYFSFDYDIEITDKDKTVSYKQIWSIKISITNIEYFTPPVFIEEEIKVIERETLISICEDSVLPWDKWQNRDSGSSQQLVSDIYSLLKAGAEYTIKVEQDHTIWIEFVNVTYEEIRNAIDNHYLYVDDIDEYKEANPEDEMFYGYGLSLGEVTPDKIEAADYHLSGYLPTRKRLQECDGEDWY